MAPYQNDITELPSRCPDQWSVRKFDEDPDGGNGEHNSNTCDANRNNRENTLPTHVLENKIWLKRGALKGWW